MNCEDLMMHAKVCKNCTERKKLMEEAFYANYGITMVLLKQFGLNEQNFDDFVQMAYLAFDKTVRTYDQDSTFSMLSYYRLNLKHECYVSWLDEKKHMLCTEDELNAVIEYSEPYNKMKGVSEIVEEEFMDKLLWERVQRVLQQPNSQIVVEKYAKQRTLTSIGREYGISAERVRQRLLKSYSVLHDDLYVRDIAEFYHYL